MEEKKLQNKMLLETVSERGREKQTKDGIGGEIEKVNGMLGPPYGGLGYTCRESNRVVGRGLCVINREF